MNKTLLINLSGSPKLLLEQKDITEQLSSKSIAIITYIWMDSNKKISRKKMAQLLWEASDDNAARYNLRYNIWAINKFFRNLSNGENLLVCEKNHLTFDQRFTIKADIEIFENIKINKIQNFGEKLLIEAKTKYKGNFMESFYLKNCNEFNDWLFFERDNFQKKYVIILETLKNYYINNNKFEKATLILKEMIKLNPYDELIYVELINVLLKKGNRAEALKQYNRCANVLREELNITMMPSTKKVIEVIKNANYKEENELKEYLSNSIFQSIRHENIVKEDNGLYLEIKCYKPLNTRYSYMGELVRLLIEQSEISENVKLNIDDYQGLYFINPDVFKINDNYVKNVSEKIFDNYIFRLMTSLINNICEFKKINISIYNSRYMDEKSLEFLTYFFYKSNLKGNQIKIYFNGEVSEIISELIKHTNLDKSW